MWWRQAVVVVLASGCGFSAPGAATDGAAGDAGSSADADPDAPRIVDGGTCASVHHTCVSATQLEICDAVGVSAIEIDCTWGCRSASPDQCKVMTPAGGVLTPSDSVHPTVTYGDIATLMDGRVWHIDTDSGMIKADGSVVRVAGEGVHAGIAFEKVGGHAAIFRVGSLVAGNEIHFFGHRTASLVVTTDVVLHAPIVLGEGCEPTSLRVGGLAGGDPGADASDATGGRRGSSTATTFGGGGGGANASRGGPGGSTLGAGGGMGGTSYPDVEIAKLRGGGGGGGGGGSGGGRGGSGGGAFQILALGSITIDTGSISAGGCGGDGGSGGGGGGAGGAILLDAPVITIGGTLAANGGGGGAGGGSGGQPGTASTTAAMGGVPASLSAGFGGNGGAGSFPSGIFGIPDGAEGGGGGGGVGRIRVNTTTGVVAGTPTYSPARGSGTVVGSVRVD